MTGNDRGRVSARRLLRLHHRRQTFFQHGLERFENALAARCARHHLHHAIGHAKTFAHAGDAIGTDQIALVPLHHCGQFRGLLPEQTEIDLEVAHALFVVAQARKLAVDYEHHAIHVAQHHLTYLLMRGLTRHRAQVNAHVVFFVATDIDRQQVEEQGALRGAVERDQFAAPFGLGVLVDVFEVGGFSAQTRAVVDDLQSQLAAFVIDVRHAQRATIPPKSTLPSFAQTRARSASSPLDVDRRARRVFAAMSNWIRTAEAALSGQPIAGQDVQLLEIHAPPLFDAAGLRSLSAPLMAAFLWAAALFRELQSHSPLDPLALLLRFVALALTVRALRVLWQLAQRLRVRLERRRYALALTEHGLLYRSPNADIALPREHVLDVREQGANWGERSGPRWADVYLVTHPDSTRLYLALPPVFERSPKALAELLMRWRRSTDSQLMAADESDLLASQVWEEAASGRVLPGVAVIRQGNAWLQRVPYASMLLGVAVLDGFLRLPLSSQQALNPTPALLLAAALVIVPLIWFVSARTRLRQSRGLSLLLTPNALLMRTRAGVTRVAWNKIARSELISRNTWSILQGAHESRSVVLHRKAEPSIHYAEALMAVPAEVVCALCDAYRRANAAHDASSASASEAQSTDE
jgi:hypothetical protein